MRTTSLPCISALNVQPTPQYAHVVMTLCSGWPISMIDFSVSVAVGQACTHAPHDTHSDPRNDVPPGDTFEANPRPAIVRANVPWVSSHARTQREHTMHFAGSNVKYGLDSSFSACRWLAPSNP